MIRGHIDFVSRGRVEGWIHSEKVRLTGQTVLAFVDETCVGGGPVEIFRQDLLDAGLGDGVVGFAFPVMLEPWHDPRTLDIRLDGGSMQIKQAGACLVARDSVGEDRKRQGRDAASLSWMLARGWLTQSQYEALRILSEFGVHAQALRRDAARRSPDEMAEDVALVAGEECELHMVQPIAIEIRDRVAPADLPAIRRELRVAFPFVPPVIGLWSPRRLHLGVEEGSHRDGAQSLAGGAVEYTFGDRHLLMLDLDTRHGFPPGEAPRFTAFVPSPPQA
ncbi:hypothetical protein [Aurantimonas sp. Leaf443]|uniref:hypothetical protein n=1 Tax=Aurantimonas sp. Leaf443 TaxID=1736378 RepID=UPI0006F65BB0|nr:hypothetical protein [Aurantimonas sp. Leaf443]KQT82831.1 hypothetical protein ASG48_15200 [Aurantimonas sp. Leaf443]